MSMLACGNGAIRIFLRVRTDISVLCYQDRTEATRSKGTLPPIAYARCPLIVYAHGIRCPVLNSVLVPDGMAAVENRSWVMDQHGYGTSLRNPCALSGAVVAYDGTDVA